MWSGMEDLSQTLSCLSALSQETRLRAFRALMEAGRDGMAAGDLSEALKVAPNSLSTHLAVLCRSGLVSVQRKGRYKIYKAQITAINGLLSSLVETCCHGHPEVCGMLATLETTACT